MKFIGKVLKHFIEFEQNLNNQEESQGNLVT